MFADLLEKFFKKNHAPDWFVQDMKAGVAESEIKEKIKIEIYNEVVNRGYDMNWWTDEFIGRLAGVYYGFFDQLYMQSA